MRRILAAAALLALPVYVWAQTITQDGQSSRGVQQGVWVSGMKSADSTGAILRVDANGYLQVTESAPTSALLYDHPSIISTSLIAGNSDSSAAYPMIGANHIYLYFTFLDSSVTSASLWAIQVRRHQNTAVDSLSTWPIMWTPTNTTTTGITNFLRNGAVDTLGTLLNTAAGPLANEVVWPMEYMIAWPNGMKGPRRQFSIEVTDRNGSPLTGTYISVRARLLLVNKGLAGSIAARSIIRVDMQGTR